MNSKLNIDIDKIKQKLNKKVKVGVINGGEFYDKNNKITLAGYGYVNEMGSITRNIPQRSFIRVPLNLHLKDRINKYKNKLKELIFNDNIDEAYNLLGIIGKSIVQESFTNNSWAPNKPSTIKRKGSSRPLIDTGRLRQSITYKVVSNDN